MVQSLVQLLLEEDQNSRLAYEAADVVMLLTCNNPEQAGFMSQEGTPEGLLTLISRLLQASDALSDGDGAGMDTRDAQPKPHDSDAHKVNATSQLSSLKIGSDSALSLVHTLEKPRVSWSASSLQIVPGSPAILTLPNGQCSECAIPQSPSSLAELQSTCLKVCDTTHAAADVPYNRGEVPSTSAAAQPLTPGSHTFDKSLSIRKSPSRSLSATLSNSWVGSLVKRLGSTNSRNPSSDSMAAQPDSAQWAGRSTTPSPFASHYNSASPSAVHNQLGRSQSVRSESWDQPSSVRVRRKVYQPRHPSQALLRKIITATVQLVGGNPSCQGTFARLGAIALAQDVLTLAGKVGQTGGLVRAGADLVQCLSDGNPHAQQAFGQAGCVGQLLSLLQVPPPLPSATHTSALCCRAPCQKLS